MKVSGTAILGAIAALTMTSGATADEAKLLTLDAVYTGEVLSNARGGIRRGTAYMDNFDLMLTGDLAAAGWQGGSFFLYGLYNNNTTFSDRYAGDAQVVSNIDSDRHFRLYEAWMQQEFGDGAASIKAGLIDLNSEFDAKEFSALFINSSHGIGPDFSQTGENGPSIFPSTSLAVRLDAKLGENWKVRVGAFDAVPNDPDRPARMKLSWSEGTLFAGEVEYNSSGGFRAVVGGWAYSSDFEPILPHAAEKIGGNKGGYAFVEGPLSDKVAGYLRVGIADTEINAFGGFLGGGLVAKGLIPGRDDDEAGIAIAHPINGGDYKRAVRLDGDRPVTETNIEFTYRSQLTDWLAVQPFTQYIVNPGAVSGLRDALVIGVRFEVGASF